MRFGIDPRASAGTTASECITREASVAEAEGEATSFKRRSGPSRGTAHATKVISANQTSGQRRAHFNGLGVLQPLASHCSEPLRAGATLRILCVIVRVHVRRQLRKRAGDSPISPPWPGRCVHTKPLSQARIGSLSMEKKLNQSFDQELRLLFLNEMPTVFCDQ